VPGGQLSGPDYHDIHDHSGVFSAMSLYFGGETGVRIGDEAEFTTTMWVGNEFFSVFRIAPVAGRLFSADEQKPNGPPAAIISADLAQRRFGSAAAAVGQRVNAEGKSTVIVGVAPSGFHFPEACAVWFPAAMEEETSSRSAHNYKAIARLRPGVTLQQAQARLATLGERLARQYPETNKQESFTATELRVQMTGRYRSTLGLLGAAVAVLFLIACANVASIMLARASARGREIAVRAAIGASRAQIIRQLIVESGLLALCAGVVGVALSHWLTAGLTLLAPTNVPRLAEVSVDGSVLLFTLAASICATMLFGLLPAWQASRFDLNQALRQGVAQGALGGRSGAVRAVIAASQIALCFVLITGAMLLFRSFIDLTRIDMGIRPDHVLVTYAAAPADTLNEYISEARFFVNLRKQVEALPGVVSSSAVMGLPTGRYWSNGAYRVEGRPEAATFAEMPVAGFRVAAPNYFATMGIPLLRGRDFNERDGYEAPFVAIVSEALVRQAFPGQNPIGQRILCGFDSPKPMTIVGVVGDVRSEGPSHPPDPELYMPPEQHPYHSNEMQVVTRTSLPPMALQSAVRRTIHQLNPDVAVQFTTMDDMLADSIASPRFRTALIGVFAGIAMALVLAGVYGLMSYTVALRSSELGLRMALGARSADIARLVLTRALAVAAWGLSAGVVLAIAAHRLIAGMLYNITAADPMSWMVAVVLIAVAATVAALVPARRAVRLDPVQTLRSE